jgi:hypothetical protein
LWSQSLLGLDLACTVTHVSSARGLFQRVTNRFEKSRLPYSCDGDPAPSLVPAAVFVGKRMEPSTGDVLPVEEPECGAVGFSWGM